ncbi:hypothetical protein FRC04_012173 [Tulasnella sp. 424]|nr:hypothetical protein FRC04_012173 [Tulasnella sp. 424]
MECVRIARFAPPTGHTVIVERPAPDTKYRRPPRIVPTDLRHRATPGILHKATVTLLEDLLTLIPQAHQCTQAPEVSDILSVVDRGLRLHDEHQTVLLPDQDYLSQPRTTAQKTNTRRRAVMMTGVGQQGDQFHVEKKRIVQVEVTRDIPPARRRSKEIADAETTDDVHRRNHGHDLLNHVPHLPLGVMGYAYLSLSQAQGIAPYPPRSDVPPAYSDTEDR